MPFPRTRAFALFLSLGLASTASAQTPQPEEVAPLVARATEVFLKALAISDEDTQRAFFGPGLAEIASPEDWSRQRALIEDKLGATPAYAPHKVTWYPQGSLYVAIDISAEVTPDETYVCGAIVWELPTAETIGLVRLEENIVERSIFANLTPQTAEKTLLAWYCPPDLVARLLPLSKP